MKRDRAEPIDVYIFRDGLSPAGDTIVCIARRSALKRYISKEEIDKAFSGYVTYHHDMFQTGYGSKAVPPTGIPDPEFSPYHRQVFEFLKERKRYQPPR